MDLSNPYVGPLYALVAGILTSASPCALAAIPLVIGHMTGSAPHAGKRARFRDLLFFLLGMAMALTLAGVVAGAFGRSLILTAPWVRLVAGLAFIVGGAAYLGLLGGTKTCKVPLSLGDVDKRGGGGAAAGSPGGDSFATGTQRVSGVSRSRWAVVKRSVSGLLMGALYGLSASPCATPALLAILALVATTGSISRGAVLLLAYSMGQSVLVAAAGLATAKFQAVLESQSGQKAVETLRKLGGAVIIGFGVYLLVRPYI